MPPHPRPTVTLRHPFDHGGTSRQDSSQSLGTALSTLEEGFSSMAMRRLRTSPARGPHSSAQMVWPASPAPVAAPSHGTIYPKSISLGHSLRKT